MSVYFFSNAWIFAENPNELDQITNEKMIELAIAPGQSDSEGEAWLTEARKERAGEIQKRTPHMMKVRAGGSRGHCMCVEELSKLHPDFLFIVTSGADCSDEMRLSFITNDKCYLTCEVSMFKHDMPFGLSSKTLADTEFDKIKEIFEEIKKVGPDLILYSTDDLDITDPPFGMEENEK